MGIQEVTGSALKVLKLVSLLEGSKYCTEEVEKWISWLEGLEADIAGVDSDDESEGDNLEENNESEEESEVYYGPIDVRGWPSSHARFLGYNI